MAQQSDTFKSKEATTKNIKAAPTTTTAPTVPAWFQPVGQNGNPYTGTQAQETYIPPSPVNDQYAQEINSVMTGGSTATNGAMLGDKPVYTTQAQTPAPSGTPTLDVMYAQRAANQMQPVGWNQPRQTQPTVDHTRDDWYNPASSPQWTPYNSSLYGPAANTATGNMDNWMYPQQQQPAPAWTRGLNGYQGTRNQDAQGSGTGSGGGGGYGGRGYGGGYSPFASNYGWNDYGNGYGGSNYAPAWYMNLANWNIK